MANIRTRRKIPIRFLAIFLLTVCAAAFWMEWKIRPVMRQMVADQAQVMVSQRIAQALSELLSEQAISYDSLVQVKTDENQRVTSVETNIVQVNKLKNQVEQRVLQVVQKYDDSGVRIPVGTLTGSEFLRGRGPSVSLRFQLTGTVQPELKNEFISAGINQTCHRIRLKVPVQLGIIVPGCETKTSADTEYLIAETVIVGTVPKTYMEGGSIIAATD